MPRSAPTRQSSVGSPCDGQPIRGGCNGRCEVWSMQGFWYIDPTWGRQVPVSGMRRRRQCRCSPTSNTVRSMRRHWHIATTRGRCFPVSRMQRIRLGTAVARNDLGRGQVRDHVPTLSVVAPLRRAKATASCRLRGAISSHLEGARRGHVCASRDDRRSADATRTES